MTQLEDVFREVIDDELARESSEHAHFHREFARERPREGFKALDYLLARYPDAFAGTPRIVDVGGGNGGFGLPFATRPGFRCYWTDFQHAPGLSRVLEKTSLTLHRCLSDAAKLPYRSASVDVVLYAETIEHVNASAVGKEIARILKPGGLCYVTTPARFRFLLGPDPHYGIRGLLLLPDPLQKILFNLLRRGKPYEVEHIFWSSWGVARTLPGCSLVEVTGKHFAGPLRRFDWDWIILRKRSQPQE
jgi:SAM-dependent methyltransferase